MLVADDSPVFLDAAAAVVEATPGFEIAATCRSETRAIELAGTLRPNVVLLDESMAGADPAAAAREIAATSPETFVILVSADPKPAGETPLINKGELSPARLADLWRQRPAPGTGGVPAA